MNIKYVIVCLFFAISPSIVSAQVEYLEEKTKINSIKKNKNYIYGEGIATTEQEALESAESSLRTEIMRLVSQNEALQDTETILLNAVKKNSSRVELKRGSMARVFLYVLKTNVISNNEVIAMDNPAVTVNENKQESTVDKEELAPFVNDVELEEITSPVLRTIVSQTNISDLQQCLKELKSERKVMFGNVSSELNPAWYIIAYSDEGVQAILDKGISKRKNLLTGEIENLSSYSRSKKIWFLIYE